jgi:Recombinase
VVLGNPNIDAARSQAVAAIKAEADRAAGNAAPIIADIRRTGATTLRQIADALNARGVPTPRGGRWYAMSVRNALAR